MNTIYLAKKEKLSKKGYVVNLGWVCGIFVFLGVVLSMLYLRQSILEEERAQRIKREELSSVSVTMNSIASFLDSGAIGRARSESLYIRESGVLSAVSARNRRMMYEFLFDVSQIDPTETAKYSAYARSCSVCAKRELAGDEFELDEWRNNNSESPKFSPKNAIGIAKSVSDVGLYPRFYYHETNVCTFGSNFYRKLDYYDTCEYVRLVGTSDEFDESYDLGYLKNRIDNNAEAELGNADGTTYLFEDMGVVFFLISRADHGAYVGITADGEQTYLYCETREECDFSRK